MLEGKAAGTIDVDSIAAARLVLQRVQRPVVGTLSREVTDVIGIMPDIRVIRSDVDGTGRDRHRGGEVDLLPARGGLAREGGGGQQRRRMMVQRLPMCVPVFVRCSCRSGCR